MSNSLCCTTNMDGRQLSGFSSSSPIEFTVANGIALLHAFCYREAS